MWFIEIKALEYTANVYREIQGHYREIGLQGYLFYRDILGMRLAVIVAVEKVVMIKGILFSPKTAMIFTGKYYKFKEL